NGLDLHVAFTAEESPDVDGKVKLRPWTLPAGEGRGEQTQQIVHAMVLHLSVTSAAHAAQSIEKKSFLLNTQKLVSTQFGLLLQVVGELRTREEEVFTGPDTGLIIIPWLEWRTAYLRVEVR